VVKRKEAPWVLPGRLIQAGGGAGYRLDGCSFGRMLGSMAFVFDAVFRKKYYSKFRN